MARYSGAKWRPTTKHGYGSTDTNSVKRVIDHSAEGYRGGMFAVLDGIRQASWHFSVMQNGEVYQHVDTGQISWGAGSFDANNGSINIEHEGVKGQALTSAQYSATLKLHAWIWPVHNLGTPSRSTNLKEHKEFLATACPSNRIPWSRLIPDLKTALAPATPPTPVGDGIAYTIGPEGARGLYGVWEKLGKPQNWDTWLKQTLLLNGWSGTPVLQIGQVIQIPGSAPAPTPPPPPPTPVDPCADLKTQLAKVTKDKEEWRQRYSTIMTRYDKLKTAVLAASRLAV